MSHGIAARDLQAFSRRFRHQPAEVTAALPTTALSRCPRPTVLLPKLQPGRSSVRVPVSPNDPSQTAADFLPQPGYIFGPEEELALVSFHIPVASPTTEPADVVMCPDIRDLLVPRDSPLLPHDNFGGGFVDDEDRIALNTMRLSSVASSGATDMCVDLPDSGILDGPDEATSRILAWPVTRAVPAVVPEDNGGGNNGAGGDGGRWGSTGAPTRVGDGQQGVRLPYTYSGAALPPSRPPSQQGISAMAARVPAEHPVRAAAAAAAAAAASGSGGGDKGKLGGGFAATLPMNRQLHNVSTLADRVCVSLPSWAMRAGPRKRIYFDPARVSAAVVTCGHICPGVNDVVQAIVHRLTDYGVPEGQVLGICDGFKGFDPRHPAKPRPLSRHAVEGAHLRGGSLLGTSKGWADIDAVVAKIAMWDINALFVVGGDGGLRAAQLISEQCRARELPCCVVGVPKSIENDILLVDRTFGFETAVQEVQRPLLAAKVEASSIRGGIGLVKVMGRHSGFLAMQASLASGVVDVCLIPEVSFTMDGPHGLLAYLGMVLQRKGHAVVCVAEGAGQDLISAHTPQTKDLLGNPVLHDIGIYLKARFKMHFKYAAEVRYIDPTYMIRTTPCNSLDHIYARVLAHNAVDAAFSGFTGVTVGMCNNHHVLLPIPLVVQAPRRVDPWGMAWNRLRADSGQPSFHPPPSLGRAAVSSFSSSMSATESDTEGPPPEGVTTPGSETLLSSSSPSPSPAASSASASTAAFPEDTLAKAGAAAATADTEVSQGEVGQSRAAAADLREEVDVMTPVVGVEPVGPQDSMDLLSAAAGSQGLYGGGAAISPPGEPAADRTGQQQQQQQQQLHVLSTEPVQADLPWPSPPPLPPPNGMAGSHDNMPAFGDMRYSVDVELGDTEPALGPAVAAPPPTREGEEEGAAGERQVAQPVTEPGVEGGGERGAGAVGSTTTPAAAAAAAAYPPSAGSSAPVNESYPATSPATSGGPLGALGAVLRSVTGGSCSTGGGAEGKPATSSGGVGDYVGGVVGGNGNVRKGTTSGTQRQGSGDQSNGRTAAAPPRPPSPSKRPRGHRTTPRYPHNAEDESE